MRVKKILKNSKKKLAIFILRLIMNIEIYRSFLLINVLVR